MTGDQQFILAVLTQAVILIVGFIALYVKIKEKVNEIHISLNSRLTELLASEKKISYSEGKEAAGEDRGVR